MARNLRFFLPRQVLIAASCVIKPSQCVFLPFATILTPGFNFNDQPQALDTSKPSSPQTRNHQLLHFSLLKSPVHRAAYRRRTSGYKATPSRPRLASRR
ncbi:hypothetical protein C8R44DRAFT_760790 [Mycena epipterygia]|nr:hypothetical protein C8R44DRAFT_760790 [Mycena epipterygia]